MTGLFFPARRGGARIAGVTLALILSTALPGQAQTTAFSRALAEAASGDAALAEFYRNGSYATLWTGPQDTARRAAFLPKILLVTPAYEFCSWISVGMPARCAARITGPLA